MISDALGVSGRGMLEALVEGETDPAALAALNLRLKARPTSFSPPCGDG